MPIADVPGAALYYEVHGAGPWLVFAHGAGGNHLSWWQQVPAFAPRFRCLVFDQRGWGRSTCAGVPDPVDLAGDLSALLDHLGVERAALVGQSMGGWTVLGCALARPERVTHLVLTATLAGLTDDAIFFRLAELHDAGRPLGLRGALAPEFPARNPVRTFLYEGIAGLNPPAPDGFIRRLIALRQPLGRARLDMPVLFLAGGRDQLFPPDVIGLARARLPGAALVVVPGAGHSAYFECPDEFNRVLAAFLAGEVPGDG